ncbi:hypothetical protein PM082_024760 [Marasmius tenuissimus]|nr:hypothetical protein PM082_024760 [Marasmius tenuissimus]
MHGNCSLPSPRLIASIIGFFLSGQRPWRKEIHQYPRAVSLLLGWRKKDVSETTRNRLQPRSSVTPATVPPGPLRHIAWLPRRSASP